MRPRLKHPLSLLRGDNEENAPKETKLSKPKNDVEEEKTRITPPPRTRFVKGSKNPTRDNAYITKLRSKELIFMFVEGKG